MTPGSDEWVAWAKRHLGEIVVKIVKQQALGPLSADETWVLYAEAKPEGDGTGIDWRFGRLRYAKLESFSVVPPDMLKVLAERLGGTAILVIFCEAEQSFSEIIEVRVIAVADGSEA